MKSYLSLAAGAIVAAVSLALAVADEGESSPTVPAPLEGRNVQNRPSGAARIDGPAAQPEPELIELSGRLRRPVKWTPQLELIPCGQDIKRFDLQGELLRNIKDGTAIRVRGAVRSFLHRGGTKENPSPFPPQWTIQLHVTHVELLDDPHDVLKTDADAPSRQPNGANPCRIRSTRGGN